MKDLFTLYLLTIKKLGNCTFSEELLYPGDAERGEDAIQEIDFRMKRFDCFVKNLDENKKIDIKTLEKLKFELQVINKNIDVLYELLVPIYRRRKL